MTNAIVDQASMQTMLLERMTKTPEEKRRQAIADRSCTLANLLTNAPKFDATTDFDSWN